MDLYGKFEKMFDGVCQDVAKELKGEPAAMLVSGGIDSMCIFAGMQQTDANIYLTFMRRVGKKGNWRKSGENKQFGSERQYDLFLEGMTTTLARKFDYPLIILPFEPKPNPKFQIPPVFVGTKIKYVIGGDGMDRPYSEVLHYTKDGKISRMPRTYGELMHAKHPTIDTLMHISPKLKSYKKPISGCHYLYDTFWQWTDEIQKEYKVKIVQPGYHPAWCKFFHYDYKENIKNLLWDRRFTYQYVENKLGFSYWDIVKEVYEMNKPKFKPWGEVVKEKLFDGKKAVEEMAVSAPFMAHEFADDFEEINKIMDGEKLKEEKNE